MSYEPPKYTKNKVNLAGDILARRKKSDNFDALTVLNNWRAAHAYPTDKFHNTLKRKIKKIDAGSFSSQRYKRAPSIIEKLKRYKTMNLAQMQDIGGVGRFCRVCIK